MLVRIKETDCLYPLGNGVVEGYYESSMLKKFSLDVDGHIVMSEQDYDYYFDLFSYRVGCEQFRSELVPSQYDRYNDMMDAAPDGLDDLEYLKYCYFCLCGIFNGGL